jgi:uncharacterized protein YqjF (DUF2071 family)
MSSIRQNRPIFLKAEWRKLAMANYAVDPKILEPYVPHGTELDFWNDTCYVSLVGFMFVDTKIKSLKIPFHVNFEEVNLRFYVRYNDSGQWKRGVVFIREIVPKFALTFVANTIYGENYETMPMLHQWDRQTDFQTVQYQWKKANQWYGLKLKAALQPQPILADSEAEFITEHYWGYTKRKNRQTSEYAVEHERWDIYDVLEYNIDVDFGKVYGKPFEWLTDAKPASVFLAEGSGIIVRGGRRI